MNALDKLCLSAKYAKHAYGEPRTEHETLISNVRTDAQVLIAKKVKDCDYDAIVSFRGTSSPRDARMDLDIRRCVPAFFKNIHPPLRVHKGFCKQYESVRPELMKEIEGCRKILTASHSLGAAASTLFALDMAINKPDVDVECVTFGSPRTGGPNFANTFNLEVNDKNTRCVHNNDVVTWVPIPLRFKHVSGLLKLSTDRSKTPVGDHDMDHYVAALDSFVRK